MAEPDRTNADAERVSDIVKPDDIPQDVWNRAKAALMQASVKASHLAEPVDPLECISRAIMADRADIIEAQSKALAEARVTAIEECAQIADAVRQRMELGRKGKALNQIDEHVAGVCDSLAQRIRSLTPTPENPNG